MPRVLTIPPSQSSSFLDTLETLDSPPPCLHDETSSTTCLVSEGNIPRDLLAAANYKLFGDYQDYVHQNPGTHMYGSIEENGKWQERCKRLSFCPPNDMVYFRPGWEEVCLNSSGEDQQNPESRLEYGEDNCFHVVIFQHAPLVSVVKYIPEWITSCIDFCNKGAYNKLLLYSYVTAATYLEKAHGTQNQEQHHHTFSNLL